MPVDQRRFGARPLIVRRHIGGYFAGVVRRAGGHVQRDRRGDALLATDVKVFIQAEIVVELPVLVKGRFQHGWAQVRRPGAVAPVVGIDDDAAGKAQRRNPHAGHFVNDLPAEQRLPLRAQVQLVNPELAALGQRHHQPRLVIVARHLEREGVARVPRLIHDDLPAVIRFGPARQRAQFNAQLDGVMPGARPELEFEQLAGAHGHPVLVQLRIPVGRGRGDQLRLSSQQAAAGGELIEPATAACPLPFGRQPGHPVRRPDEFGIAQALGQQAVRGGKTHLDVLSEDHLGHGSVGFTGGGDGHFHKRAPFYLTVNEVDWVPVFANGTDAQFRRVRRNARAGSTACGCPRRRRAGRQ
ncbi:MAG: hypothetical protein BWY76_01372 [bacterium ADurb.Bin429]|nr:MAG: hypothetical protein BWY76_01372 [bacterium ADurb.Bin429]